MRRSLATVLAALGAAAAIAGAPAAAGAHGPCGCTFPAVARPGTTVTTGPAYRIVVNPPVRFFRGAAGTADLASGYRADAPTAEVLRRPRPKWPKRAAPGRFRVPRDTPPGIYLVMIFDGGEAGMHATWDYLHVPDPPLDRAQGEFHEVLALIAAVLPPL